MSELVPSLVCRAALPISSGGGAGLSEPASAVLDGVFTGGAAAGLTDPEEFAASFGLGVRSDGSALAVSLGCAGACTSAPATTVLGGCLASGGVFGNVAGFGPSARSDGSATGASVWFAAPRGSVPASSVRAGGFTGAVAFGPVVRSDGSALGVSLGLAAACASAPVLGGCLAGGGVFGSAAAASVWLAAVRGSVPASSVLGGCLAGDGVFGSAAGFGPVVRSDGSAATASVWLAAVRGSVPASSVLAGGFAGGRVTGGAGAGTGLTGIGENAGAFDPGVRSDGSAGTASVWLAGAARSSMMRRCGLVSVDVVAATLPARSSTTRVIPALGSATRILSSSLSLTVSA